MSALWSAKPVASRRRRWPVRLIAAGPAVLAVLVLASPVAVGASQRSARPTKAPASVLGDLLGVTAVPHSTDIWAYGAEGLNSHLFVAHRHDGHWQRVTPPSLGGKYGQIVGITAGSAGTVWLLGGVQQAGIQELPAVWRWSGKRFIRQHLPPLQNGELQVSSADISASSATNAWVTGGLYTPSNPLIALHWNGKTWASVPTPNGAGLGPVATSSATNAWAEGSGTLDHWNGATWSVDGTVPASAQITALATSSPTLAYAAGFNATTFAPVILRFNGASWTSAPLASKAKRRNQIEGITMHGRAAWTVGASDGRPTIPHHWLSMDGRAIAESHVRIGRDQRPIQHTRPRRRGLREHDRDGTANLPRILQRPLMERRSLQALRRHTASWTKPQQACCQFLEESVVGTWSQRLS